MMGNINRKYSATFKVKHNLFQGAGLPLDLLDFFFFKATCNLSTN